MSYATGIALAQRSAGLSQRDLAARAGMSQATLSRVISGERQPKIPELLAIARVTGWTVGGLSGASEIADRAQCAARVTNGSDADVMRATLINYLELDAYLADQAI